jgi:hypothetical protein
MIDFETLLFFLPFAIGLVVPGGVGKKKSTEDSAAAVLIIAAASRWGFINLPYQLEEWVINRMHDACEYVQGKVSPFGLFQLPKRSDFASAVLGRFFQKAKPQRVVLNPFIAEFVSQGILRSLGIRTAPVEILTAAEACNTKDVVVKWVQPATGVLKYDPEIEARAARGELADVLTEEPCLLSRLVPKAASLSYIAKTFNLVKPIISQRVFDLTQAEASQLVLGETMTTWAKVSDKSDWDFAEIIGKECQPAEKFYEGFTPKNSDRIRKATAWDGEQFLTVCAARVFLGCSAPHMSNVLCTEDGELISIDHCTTLTDDGESVRMLFKYTRKGTLGFDALRHVGKLTDGDIKAAIAEVPRHPACGSPPDALERNLKAVENYYISQLGLWKKLLREAEESVASSVVSLRSEREQQQVV